MPLLQPLVGRLQQVRAPAVEQVWLLGLPLPSPSLAICLDEVDSHSSSDLVHGRFYMACQAVSLAVEASVRLHRLGHWAGAAEEAWEEQWAPLVRRRGPADL